MGGLLCGEDCGGMDADRAYIYGLLHDIGKFDVEDWQVRERYGYYPQSKWDRNVELKEYFEKKAGKTVEDIMG